MNVFLILTILSLITFSCSDNSETSKNDIVGQWKLSYYHSNPWSSYIHDHSKDKIVYNFKPNGILIVNGNGLEAPHADGQHEYFFREDFLSGIPTDPKTLLVKIDGGKWTYSFAEGQMILSQMYVDGSSLTL